MPVNIVEYDEKHLKSIVDLMNGEYKNSNGFIPFDEERVKSQIRRRHLNILLAEERNNVIGLIATHTHEDSEIDITWLAVAKKPEQRIIENMLVSKVESYPKVKTIVTSIDQTSPHVNDWIKRGYKLEPGFQRMCAELTGTKPIPKVPENVTLRTLRSNEETEFVAATNAGFGWKRLEPGDLEIWKKEDPPFNEDWVQIAEVNGKIVSAVVAKPETDSIRYLHENRGYLGPAATLPEFRNMHLATALTAKAMNTLFEKGMESVRLGTSELNVSSNALLRSLGFRVENVRKTMRKKLRET